MDAALSHSNAYRNSITFAIRIEVLTVLWMIVEASLSIGAGIQAHSTALIVFGADSVIELLTAGILLWRLNLERTQGHSLPVQKAENRAGWITGIALAILCVYVIIEVIFSLVNRDAVQSSPLGIAVSIAAVAFMPLLGIRKRKLAKTLNSSALRADAACSITCGYLAAALLIGLAVNALTGWWWVDSVVSLVLLYWLIPEAKEAFEGAKAGRSACSCEED